MKPSTNPAPSPHHPISREVTEDFQGLPGSGKRTWLRNIYLHNTPDKAAACVRYSEAIHKYIMASYNSVMKAAEDLKLKGHRGSLSVC